MFNFSAAPIILIPLAISMPTDPTEAASPTKLALLVMAGLPKHGTRWARAQHPMLRELSLEERTAPL